MKNSKGILSILIIAIAQCIQGQDPVHQNPFLKDPAIYTSKAETGLFEDFVSNRETSALAFFCAYPYTTVTFLNAISDTIEKEASYLGSRRIKNNTRYLERIFNHIHRHYLKKYRTYSTFDKVLKDQSYDCLTGTAFYAFILSRIGIPYELYETANHCYLIARLGDAQCLFESTDPLDGFISGKEAVGARQDKYAHEMSADFSNLVGMTGQGKHKVEPIKFFSEQISIHQLTGLYYYNQAVVDYNLKNYPDAIPTLEKAYTLYPCKRIINLLMASIAEAMKEKISTNQIKIYGAKQRFYGMQGKDYFD